MNAVFLKEWWCCSEITKGHKLKSYYQQYIFCTFTFQKYIIYTYTKGAKQVALTVPPQPIQEKVQFGIFFKKIWWCLTQSLALFHAAGVISSRCMFCTFSMYLWPSTGAVSLISEISLYLTDLSLDYNVMLHHNPMTRKCTVIFTFLFTLFTFKDSTAHLKKCNSCIFNS